MKDKLSEEQELEEFDQWLRALPVQNVLENFTATVIAYAILMKKRQKSLRLMLWTIGMLSVILGMSFFVEPTTAYELPDIPLPRLDSNRYMEWLNGIRLVFMDQTVLMFCVVLEAVLCLLMIDQIVNHYRYIKKNVTRYNL